MNHIFREVNTFLAAVTTIEFYNAQKSIMDAYNILVLKFQLLSLKVLLNGLSEEQDTLEESLTPTT